jgi:ligand-binding sensor domain-containing protein/signal transduction histidine kinase
MKSDTHIANSQSCNDSIVKKYILRLFIGSMLLQNLIVSSSFALDPQKQISQYGYSTWSRQNGLPANAINVAIQSHDGYLWLGTTAGLLRFDGVRFEVIGTDTADSKNREVITALCETLDSTIWIGTRYAGLRRLKDGRLLPCGLNEGFPVKPIKALLESHSGHLWIGSSDGLFEYIDGRFKSIPINPLFITSLTEDESGKIFVGTGKGVHSFEEAGAKYIKSVTQKDGLPNELITTVYADHQGNVWIGTEYGSARWNNNKIIIARISTNPGLLHITSICEDRNGNLWIGTSQGIFRFSEGKWTNFKATDGLLSDNVLSILEDQEGSIWVCTSEGLVRFRDVNVTTYTSQEGVANNYITSVIESTDGSMYLLSAASGGSISKLKKGKLTQIPNPPPVGPAFLARDGSIWTSLSGSLSQIKNDRITRYDTATGLPNRWISAITEDSLSLIIYLDRIGIRRFINNRLKPYLLADGQEYSSTEYVSCFYKDKTGILWIGTSAGLVKIQNGKSTTYGTADGMADDWVGSFFEEQQNKIWVGSPRGGLTHYRDGKFIAYNTKTGLFTNEIYGVLVDDQGNVWMSSPRGIGRMSRKDVEEYESGRISVVTSQIFTTADGMRTDECHAGWQPSVWKARDKRLWFATVKGAVMIDPKKFKRNTVPPPVYIEQFIVDMQTVRPDQGKSLQPGIEKLEFHYTALSYLVPDRVFFKYKLEGYDREWVEAGTRREAYYTNLPSGSYKFRVVACNNDGVWNETGASLAFELQPHFYQTPWFFGLMLIVFGGIVFGIYRLRIWQLLQKEKDLEQRVYDRTKQLENANKELEAFSYSVSHDLRAPLRSIDGFSNALLEDCMDKLDVQGKDYLQRVCAASQHMENLIDDILNLSHVMRSDMQRTSVDLSGLAQSITGELSRTQPDRDVTFLITPGMVVHADRNLIGVVMENLLDNAWKFTSKHPTAKIEIGSTLHDGQKVYFVRDDGDGFDMAFAGKLFGAFQRMHSSAEFKGTGVGLATVRRIIDKHGGQVWAEAEKDKGATFYFTIP